MEKRTIRDTDDNDQQARADVISLAICEALEEAGYEEPNHCDFGSSYLSNDNPAKPLVLREETVTAPVTLVAKPTNTRVIVGAVVVGVLATLATAADFFY